MKKAILIIGPQGSGKGTQSKLLAKKLGLIHLDMGEIFRRFSQQPTALGRKISRLINNGQYVDDITTLSVINRLVSQQTVKNGYVFDGLPRTLHQGEEFLALLRKKIPRIQIIVIEVDLPKSEIVKRLTLRGRSDDTKKLIAKRLEQHSRFFKELSEYLKSKADHYCQINGNQSIQAVHLEILNKLPR